MVYGIILIAVGIIAAALLLLVPGTATDRIALMLSMLNTIVVIYALWIAIPGAINEYKDITVTDPTD